MHADVVVLGEFGEIEIRGENACDWKDRAKRLIRGFPVIFDSNTFSPKPILSGNKHSFQFPCFSGHNNYRVHLLSTGDALVFKDGKLYFCTIIKKRPRVEHVPIGNVYAK